MNYDGGYYLIKTDLVHAGCHSHASETPEPIPERALNAINVVQETPWRVNTWVLDVMREAWTSGIEIPGAPPPDDNPLPPRLPEAEWLKMSDEERGNHKLNLMFIHEANSRLINKRASFLRQLEIAERVRDYPAIWFSHFIDFRGRLYPNGQDLNPQADDAARGCLMFAEGKPLGARGVGWLAVRLANTFGMDKLSFNERMDWAQDNSAQIDRAGTDPFNDLWWTEADEPWSFLATCREWAQAARDPNNFVSHLPISLDGSCNGLQHLSLMGRDPVGARATNCAATEERHDLYSEVADEVNRLLREDVSLGEPHATEWLAAGVTRKTVKRAVMTTPYGVTDRGIQFQLVQDGFVSHVETHKLQSAAYLQRKIVEALTNTVVSAKEIMKYIQETAGVLADAECPLRWQTPIGLSVTQAYHKLHMSRIRTLIGRLNLWKEDKKSGLNRRKQVLASAPNFVHSFDAAMLMETALRMRDDHGVTAFSFIHDSYGTHASDTDKLAYTLRQVAADIYRTDWLAAFEAGVREYAPNVKLPARPPLGSFDPEEVRRAPYFFA